MMTMLNSNAFSPLSLCTYYSHHIFWDQIRQLYVVTASTFLGSWWCLPLFTNKQV